MIITPYDTRACLGYLPSLQKLSETLKKSYLLGGGFQHVTWDDKSNTSAVILTPELESNVKPFGHPVFIDGIRGGDNILVSDARTMFSVDTHTREIKPKQMMSTALEWTKVRLRLQLLWQSPNFPIVQTCLDYPIALYGKVMSEALARKYGLEPSVIARCDMLFAYAYWCFSHTEEQFNKVDKDSLANLLAMTIRSSGPDIVGVIKDLEYIRTLNDVVEYLKDEEIVGSQRMHSVTIAALYEIANNLWYTTAGAPAQEIIACALEHPPTWMACIYISVTNLSIKNQIGQVAQRYKRSMNPDTFANSIIHLLGEP